MTDPRVSQGEDISPTSVSLLVRIKGQDSDAWNRFVGLYSPLVFHWCRRAGLQDADAADVGQEVFRTVAGSIGGFEHGRGGGAFRGWLWTVTRSRILDFRRREERSISGVGGSDAHKKLAEVPDPLLESDDDPTSEEDKLHIVRRAVELVLDDCKQETREAFLRVVVEGRQPKDVARELELSVNAVYLAKSHILRRIREELEEIVEL